MRSRIVALVAMTVFAVLVAVPWSASAVGPLAGSCTFHSSTGVLEAEGTVVYLSQASPGGAIEVRTDSDPKAPPTPCVDADGAGLSPTGLNTESVTIVKTFQAWIPALGPGRSTGDEGGSPEIEVTFPETALAYLLGSSGDDSISIGESSGQLGFDLDGATEDASNADVDVTGPIGHATVVVYVEAGAGADTIDPGGVGSFGPEKALPLGGLHLLGEGGDDHILGAGGVSKHNSEAGGTLILGGSGDDLLEGRLAHDDLEGGSGNDVLLGNQGPDVLVGGKGLDVMRGGSGSDLIDAKDKARDKVISCGPGRDFPARVDRADPKPKSCHGLKPYDFN